MTSQSLDFKPEAAPLAEDARARMQAGLPVEERRRTLAGIETAVLEGGAGPPVVLLHGPGEFGAKWMRILPQLVAGNTVVAPDLPGHAASPAEADALTADRVLEWLEELIEETCEEPPTLVGHVLGGAIAARFAARRSERLARLVLVDTLGLARFRPTPGFGFALLRFTMRPSPRTFDRLWQRCSYNVGALRSDLGDRWRALEEYSLECARDAGRSAALRALMRGVGVPQIAPEELARITAPTTLVWGRHDQANRLAIAEAASERHGWPLRVIEGAADDPILDQPAAFWEVLATILEEES